MKNKEIRYSHTMVQLTTNRKIMLILMSVIFNTAYAENGILDFINNVANFVKGDYESNQIDSRVTRSDGWVIYNYGDGSNGRRKKMCQNNPQ